MKKLLILASATALALIFMPHYLMAAPNTISYNGKLMGKSGTPLQGSQVIEFSICDQASGGNCPWKEQRTVVFSSGVFSVQLGEVTPFPANLFQNNSLYVGVALLTSGSTWETFSPRQALTAVPYAMIANDVLQKDISPRSISISGVGVVIDAAGKWVGSPPTGLQSLISLVDEPAGANCANGGKKVLVGLDSNGNNILDTSEVSSSAFVCNGTAGAGGVPTVNKSNLTYGWTRTFGGSSSDDIKGLAIDAAGNLYVVGNYTGTFDSQRTFGGIDIFVRKYSPTGQILWTQVFGGSGKDLVTAIAVEPVSGKVYIGGVFPGTTTTDFDPDPTKQTNVGGSSGNARQPFILHLDTNGAYVWVKTFSASTKFGEGGITDLVIDENSNIYYCGTYGSSRTAPPVSINFNTDQFGNDVKSTQGYADLFVTKLDANGFYQWTYFAGQKGNYMTAARMKVKGGSVYIVGKDRTYNKILLTKLNSSNGTKAGEAVWTATDFPYLAPTGIAVDSTGSVVVSAIGSKYNFGLSSSNSGDRNLLQLLLGGKSIFPSISNSFTVIQKFDTLFNPLWTKMQGIFGSNGSYSIAVDASDNVYFGGEFSGDLITSESNVYDPRASAGGSTDISLFKLDSAGQFKWAEAIGGYGPDRLQSLLISNNDIFLGGFISAGMDGNFSRSSRNYISSNGAEDAYVSKFSGINTP